MAVQLVALDAVDAPGALARTQLQAGLLGVDRKHRELGLGEGTWKRERERMMVSLENHRVKSALAFSSSQLQNPTVIRNSCPLDHVSDALEIYVPS